ncbi:MAG: orotate phosphoribosyltransferase [Thermoanaerobaculia bacterium]|nr:orotate phosphoribosyltransferase [Thermoanaerobaculia bacterium]
MTSQVEDLIAQTRALISGHFRLSSGRHSPHYVQCARLLTDPSNAALLGNLLAQRVGPYDPSLVVAPALGGLIIGFTTAQSLELPMIFTERKDGQMVLRRGFEIPGGARVVVVEDVVTTGKSTLETDAVVRNLGGEIVAHAAIMNRSGRDNPFEEPFEFLHRLDLETWSEDECPLCAEDQPIDSPGSRFREAG